MAAADAPDLHEAPTQRRGQPPYQVVLLDDNYHTYDYVTRMLRQLFGLPRAHALRIAQAVDADGRAVLLTTTREHAELKAEQITGFGADPLIPESSGGMSALLEPAAND
jgi:ATP-dependent Clp protease adaptor protein ClpS